VKQFIIMPYGQYIDLFGSDFIAPRAAVYIITVCDVACVRRTSVLYNIGEFSGTPNQIAREECVLQRTTSIIN